MRHVMGRGVVVVVAFVAAAAMPVAAMASLPDNRIYEQVSPADKDGNVLVPTAIFPPYWGIGLAAADGNAVAYQTTGAVGSDTNQGGIQEVISRHVNGQGWTSEPADTRQRGQLGLVASAEVPGFYTTNENFEHIFFDPTGCCTESTATYSSEEPADGLDFKLYLNENPLAPPVWIGRPLAAKPIPAPGQALPNWDVAGTTPEGALFFDYSGTLLPEDEMPLEEKGPNEFVPGPESRAAHVGNGIGGNKNSESTADDAWGFYEWKDGVLSEAGVLPDGKLSRWGAVSAEIAPTFRGRTQKNNERGPYVEELNNAVSTNGKRVFFVSPDPQVEQAENGEPVAHPEPPELYVREAQPDGSHTSMLISRSEIASEEHKAGADPAEEGAPEGVQGMEDAAPGEYGYGTTDAYASPDGSRIFFASDSALTLGVVPHSEYNIYMGYAYTGGHFKLEVISGGTNDATAPIRWEASNAEVQAALEALPNVGAGNVTVSGRPPHEYEIMFMKETVSNLLLNERELVGGAYKSVTNVTRPNVYEYEVANERLTYLPQLAGARFAAASNDGTRVMLLSANGNLDLLTSGPEGDELETIVNELDTSVTPARASINGSAFLFYGSPGNSETLKQFNNGGYQQFYRYEVASKDLACVSCPPAGVNPTGPAEANLDSEKLRSTEPVRLMSEDGTRVFFNSPDPLVGADVNGEPDTYEWENGHVYLISAGNSTVPSYYIDNSASGGDVFFLTEQGLIPSDKDEQVDVYDARIPRPGDKPPPEQTPCVGEVCQGPPSVPELLTPAASATFEGLGNIPPETTQEKNEEGKPPLKCKKGFVKKNGKCQRRKTKKRPRKANRSRARGKRRGM